MQNNRIYLETFNPLFKEAMEFLIEIADPIYRPRCIHEYKITKFSLYTSIVLNRKSEDILPKANINLSAINELRESILNTLEDKNKFVQVFY